MMEVGSSSLQDNASKQTAVNTKNFLNILNNR
jgi:hypothetical protein